MAISSNLEFPAAWNQLSALITAGENLQIVIEDPTEKPEVKARFPRPIKTFLRWFGSSSSPLLIRRSAQYIAFAIVIVWSRLAGYLFYFRHGTDTHKFAFSVQRQLLLDIRKRKSLFLAEEDLYVDGLVAEARCLSLHFDIEKQTEVFQRLHASILSARRLVLANWQCIEECDVISDAIEVRLGNPSQKLGWATIIGSTLPWAKVTAGKAFRKFADKFDVMNLGLADFNTNSIGHYMLAKYVPVNFDDSKVSVSLKSTKTVMNKTEDKPESRDAVHMTQRQMDLYALLNRSEQTTEWEEAQVYLKKLVKTTKQKVALDKLVG